MGSVLVRVYVDTFGMFNFQNVQQLQALALQPVV